MSAQSHQLPNSLGFDRPPAETRVVVAMSGGVDSSTVAALLKRDGYDVVGITLQLYDHGQATHRAKACCAGQDIHDARQVADRFDFPHYVLDYERRFSEAVIEDFAASYLAGETPVPCIRCNERVKFRDLLATARELGAACLATGHYVRRVESRAGPELHRAIDPDRDQSYFLFATTHEQLDFLRFPLGALHKSETRALAHELGLDIANKPDSQDICFVPTGRYTDVIGRLRPEAGEAGDVVHLDGRMLGRHDGIMHYTIGQRKGLGVALGEPLYVVAIDAPSRQVVVGPREALLIRRIELKGVNWLGDGALADLPEGGLEIEVKVRSTQAPLPARLVAGAGGAEVLIDGGEEGVSPGQACVFYGPGSDRVLGGGWIARTDGAG